MLLTYIMYRIVPSITTLMQIFPSNGLMAECSPKLIQITHQPLQTYCTESAVICCGQHVIFNLPFIFYSPLFKQKSLPYNSVYFDLEEAISNLVYRTSLQCSSIIPLLIFLWKYFILYQPMYISAYLRCIIILCIQYYINLLNPLLYVYSILAIQSIQIHHITPYWFAK